jgi:hypothetical protein
VLAVFNSLWTLSVALNGAAVSPCWLILQRASALLERWF